MNTISVSGGILSRFSRKYSLSLLFTRFRSQAFPAFLPIASPSLDVLGRFLSIRIRKWAVRYRTPSLRTLRKSEDRRILSSLVSLKRLASD